MTRGIVHAEERVGRKGGLLGVGNLFVVEPFSTVIGNVGVVRGKYGTQSSAGGCMDLNPGSV